MIIRDFGVFTWVQFFLMSLCMASSPFERNEDGVVYVAMNNPISVNQLKTLSSDTVGIDIHDQFFTNMDLKDFAAYFSRLRVFNIGNNSFDDDGMVHIGMMTSLESLDMHYNKVTGLGIKKLAPLSQLHTLIARSLYLGNEGVETLCTVLPHLTTLDVSACGFNETVLPCFKNMPNLKSLRLSNNPINSKALEDFGTWAKEHGVSIN